MINLKSTLWQLVKRVNFPDLYFPDSIDLGIYKSNAIRITTRFINSISSNFVYGSKTSDLLILSNKFILEKKELFIGENFILLPTDKYTDISLQIINDYRGFTPNTLGKIEISCYKPSTQIVINPVTNQPVILGQESLQAIENIVNNAI